VIDYFNLDHLCPIHIHKQHILLLVVHPVTLYVLIQLLKLKNPRCFFDRTEKHRSLLILAKPYDTLAFLASKNRSLHIRYTGVLGEDEGVEICESQVRRHLDFPRVGVYIVIETFIVALPQLYHFSPVFTRGTFYFQGSAVK
jgi:hypothetical protein